jgi:hypothetical protein
MPINIYGENVGKIPNIEGRVENPGIKKPASFWEAGFSGSAGA